MKTVKCPKCGADVPVSLDRTPIDYHRRDVLKESFRVPLQDTYNEPREFWRVLGYATKRDWYLVQRNRSVNEALYVLREQERQIKRREGA